MWDEYDMKSRGLDSTMFWLYYYFRRDLIEQFFDAISEYIYFVNLNTTHSSLHNMKIYCKYDVSRNKQRIKLNHSIIIFSHCC